ncbi:MAG: hypothetical protein ACP5O7_12525, partial [Phycisphaerae bacterium]
MTLLCMVAPAAGEPSPGQLRGCAGSIPDELPQLLGFIKARRQLPVAGWRPLPGAAAGQPSWPSGGYEISRGALCGSSREGCEQLAEAYRPLVHGVAAAAYRRCGGRSGL